VAFTPHPGEQGNRTPALTIETERLYLVLQTPEEVRAFIEGMAPAEKGELSPAWLARVLELTSPDPWTHGFILRDRGTGARIGTCAFKGPPSEEGMVEIAYGVDVDHRGRGYATEAARALVAYAFGSGQVRVVRAHTLPNPNASTRVLAKCGFGFIGGVTDPDDGPVWRWERRKTPPPGI
jgi:RimJ/RimL family protein N-acetyltransferase